MRHKLLFALVVVAVAGCQAKKETAAPAAPAMQAPPAAATAPAPAPEATPSNTAGEIGQIGVTACDDYLRKWESCLATKVTGDAREQVKVALDATRDGWKRAAATPEGKAGLDAACKDAAGLASMQVSAYGCTW